MSIRPNLDAPLRGAALAIALALGPFSAPAGAVPTEAAPGMAPRVPVASTPPPSLSSFVIVTAPTISLTGMPNATVTAPTISITLSPTPRPTSGH